MNLATAGISTICHYWQEPQLFLYGSHFTDFLIYGTYNAVDTHSQMHKNVLHLHISLMDLKRLQNALDLKVGYS